MPSTHSAISTIVDTFIIYRIDPFGKARQRPEIRHRFPRPLPGSVQMRGDTVKQLR